MGELAVWARDAGVGLSALSSTSIESGDAIVSIGSRFSIGKIGVLGTCPDLLMGATLYEALWPNGGLWAGVPGSTNPTVALLSVGRVELR